MNDLSPFEVLFEQITGEEMPLNDCLANLFGRLAFPSALDRPWVITNFVSTLDGVVSLNIPGHSGGGDISGFNRHDQALMGLLRALADAVIVGAGQLRAPPGALWLPGTIYPPLAGAYAETRLRSGRPAKPLQVIVTTSGRVDTALPIFQTPGLEVLLLTSRAGYDLLAAQTFTSQVKLVAVVEQSPIAPAAILAEIQKVRPCQLALIEGGPGIANAFLADARLDELFLAVAPQVAGRSTAPIRPGFVSGDNYAPDNPRWSQLVSVRLAGSHLFLRYCFSNRIAGPGALD